MYFYASVNPAMRSWIVVIRRADPRWYQAFDSYVFMGFGAKPYAVEGAETAIWGFIRIPFWFLSGVWAALFWWGWRRTRRKEAKCHNAPGGVQATRRRENSARSLASPG